MSDAELDAATAQYMAEAQAYGVRSEAAMGRWSFMQLISEGRIGAHPVVRREMASTTRPDTPDARVAGMMRALALGLERRDAGAGLR